MLDELANVQNLRFPQDTNIHIGSLLEQRRIMQELYNNLLGFVSLLV
jgi:hypothetical protein